MYELENGEKNFVKMKQNKEVLEHKNQSHD